MYQTYLVHRWMVAANRSEEKMYGQSSWKSEVQSMVKGKLCGSEMQTSKMAYFWR